VARRGGALRRLVPSSLRARLVLAINLFVCALAVPLVVALPARIDALSRRWAESRSVGIARLLAAASEASIDFDDARDAEALLRNLGATHGAVWAALLRADGTELARWRDPPQALAASLPGGERVEYAAGLMKVALPVVARAGRTGTLALAFDLEELEVSVRETRRWLLTGAAVALVVGLLGAVAIGTFIARPLQNMTRVAERITHGDHAASARLETARPGEVGALARAFESMLARLADEQAALSRANAELTRKLSELKEAQEQLIAADRRINVGRLAAGVAHEVNNPLAYVSSNLRYVARWLPRLAGALAALDPGRAQHDPRNLAEMDKALAQASQGTDRIREIVKGLKSFSRNDDDHREPLDVRGALDAAIDMAGHEIAQRARLVKEYGAAPPVEASAVRLTQVFLNLLINAGQAIPEGAPDRHAVAVATRTDASGWAVVEVKDTGCGIRPDDLGRLFTSFFTTKPVGVGTGLGLSISKDIVEALGGRIEVESEVGRGSTFRVLLPAA
jgi:signal transduction histidine kinase